MGFVPSRFWLLVGYLSEPIFNRFCKGETLVDNGCECTKYTLVGLMIAWGGSSRLVSGGKYVRYGFGGWFGHMNVFRSPCLGALYCGVCRSILNVSEEIERWRVHAFVRPVLLRYCAVFRVGGVHGLCRSPWDGLKRREREGGMPVPSPSKPFFCTFDSSLVFGT